MQSLSHYTKQLAWNSHDTPMMIFLWFSLMFPWYSHGLPMMPPRYLDEYSHGIPMIFLWVSLDIPMVSPWHSMTFPRFPHGISVIPPWNSHEFPMMFPWVSHDIPMKFPWYSHDILTIYQWYFRDIAMNFPMIFLFFWSFAWAPRNGPWFRRWLPYRAWMGPLALKERIWAVKKSEAIFKADWSDFLVLKRS